MADITGLAGAWRAEADHVPGLPEKVRVSLRRCASELEKAWHEHAHDGSWYPEDCALCRQEMAEAKAEKDYEADH